MKIVEIPDIHDSLRQCLLNSIDYVMMPTPGLQYRTIGGVLDIYIFMGPEPEAVIQQYHHVSSIKKCLYNEHLLYSY